MDLPLSIFLWVFWYGFTVAVILIDQRRRKARAQVSDEVDIAQFEDMSIWPYLVMGLLCGALPLPLYFYATRKSAVGVLLGLGFVVASFAVTLPIAIGGQAISSRVAFSRTTKACEAGTGDPTRCRYTAMELFDRKDPDRAMAILAKGCEGGDFDECSLAQLHYEQGTDGVAKDADKAAAITKQEAAMCAANHAASPYCGMFDTPSSPNDAGIADSAPPAVVASATPTSIYCHAVMNADCPDGSGEGDKLAQAFATRCGRELDASLARGRIKTTDSEAAACATAHAAHKPKSSKEAHPHHDACNAFVEGLVAKGGACRSPYECQSHLACVGFTNDSDGKCVDPPKVGEACGSAPSKDMIVAIDIGDHPECGKTGFCEFDKCVARKPANAKCSSNTECVHGLACHVGKCGSPKLSAENGPCVNSHDCHAGLACQSSKCTAEKPAGAACKADVECKGLCDNGACKAVCGSG